MAVITHYKKVPLIIEDSDQIRYGKRNIIDHLSFDEFGQMFPVFSFEFRVITLESLPEATIKGDGKKYGDLIQIDAKRA
jgi:hypothetical protein